MIGICFGHQLIAHFLGGKTEASNKGWGIGTHQYTFTELAGTYVNGKNGFEVIVSHQDQVLEPAPGTEILAGSAFCPIAMYRIGTHIFSVQGHPEFEPGYFKHLLKLREAKFNKNLYTEAVRSIDQENDSLLIAQWIIDFIEEN